jgi:kanamycin kinase
MVGLVRAVASADEDHPAQLLAVATLMSSWTIAGRPQPGAEIPPAVRILAAGGPVQPVWENELGGLTYRLAGGGSDRYVKWQPAGTAVELDAEAVRLRWAIDYLAVPQVLGQDSDADGAWLITRGLPGASAVDPRWTRDPAPAAAAIGRGLRIMHDTLPAAGCPFSWSVDDRLTAVLERADSGLLDPVGWNPDHRRLDVTEALRLLRHRPSIDRLVVCHGDACAPNTLLNEDGTFAGHVDLGSLGVADRWADLAIATWSTTWNYGPGWESVVLDAYGIEPDAERIAYYRLLWDLG